MINGMFPRTDAELVAWNDVVDCAGRVLRHESSPCPVEQEQYFEPYGELPYSDTYTDFMQEREPEPATYTQSEVCEQYVLSPNALSQEDETFVYVPCVPAQEYEHEQHASTRTAALADVTPPSPWLRRELGLPRSKLDVRPRKKGRKKITAEVSDKEEGPSTRKRGRPRKTQKDVKPGPPSTHVMSLRAYD
ncbi:hypothetical protein BKA93DRAFT_824472 [Sparassis latifolia]|uniref:Uncharacterized protein n=1 Tax=Sparassis crispa TaxID=139825 RepID=A0A401GZE1_9APHY|nr:hypothetical protein SCP_1102230 [Sparassis crispa]GBE87546.1 hypothetical protein SCP_1102230 [Sparassis crispa]